ncbi:hypothetical protein F3Y22_tig00002840pilonHSYRG00638 [Hibiscus syriacus]|uniref:DC1 domain-containing protein n=1 Tax=Hibiscus syriacus TaxID=106335 RepID=A0A6A3CP89_HIBSY|nr:hypothetical protein F3Y22_tig00002840pilonHSYRG00638 [Hibiscus syriacus]
MESQNFGHMHTMVFNEERGNETKEAHCGICVEMVSGPCFICAECGFSPSYLHIKCALFTLSIAGKKPEELKHIATIDPPVLPGEVIVGSTYTRNVPNYPMKSTIPFTNNTTLFYSLTVNVPPVTYANRHEIGDFFIVVHRCAMREGWYVVIEAKNLDEELDDDLASINPITRVIELNEAGEMTRIKHFSHAHDLILSDNFMDNDKTCDDHPGRRWNGLIHIYEDSSLLSATFSNADFAIVRVAALPINLMCDEHPLALTYLEDNDYSEYLHCNICEKRRDQNHWFYHCAICDFSAHPQCVPQSRLLIKPGSTYKAEGHHPHPLTFVRKPHYYLRCSKCSNLCQDLALQCADSTCNYTVHWGCVKPVDFDPDKPVAFYKTQSDC